MNGTPRTDANVKRHKLCQLSGNDLVYADFPRQLERELTAAQEEIERLRDHCRIKVKALINQTSERMKAEQQRDEARRLAERYRNLSCDSQEEADEKLLPWENNQPTEP